MGREITDNGFVQLHRKMLDWEWYQEPNTKQLFIHCLLKANFKDKNWMGVDIPRGSFITSIPKLSEETGLSVQSVRTSIKRLKSTGELTDRSTNRNRMVTVNLYDQYQLSNRLANSQATGKQQTTNRQLTPTNNDNNDNNDNNISFDDFYSLYPVKKSKEPSRKSWIKLSDDERQQAFNVVKSSVFQNSMKAQLKDTGDFRPHPSTWINQKRWLDEIEVKSLSKKPNNMTEEQWKAWNNE